MKRKMKEKALNVIAYKCSNDFNLIDMKDLFHLHDY